MLHQGSVCSGGDGSFRNN